MQKDGGVCAVLEIGSSRTCCMIALKKDGKLDVAGAAVVRTEGVSGGVVTDHGALADRVMAVLGRAEQQAGFHVTGVHLVVCARSLRIGWSSGSLETGGARVDPGHLLSLREKLAGGLSCQPGETHLQDPLCFFSIDGVPTLRPLGLCARELGGDAMAFFIDAALRENLLSVVGDCNVRVLGCLPAPFLDAWGCLTREERKRGGAVVNIGRDSTSMIIVWDHRPRLLACLPRGGDHISGSIARRYRLDLTDAENTKIRHCSAIASPDRTNGQVSVVSGSGVERLLSCDGIIRDVIIPRMRELLLDATCLRGRPFGDDPVHVCVLTGGGARMPGIGALAEEVLGVNCRVGMTGRPAVIPGGYEAEPAWSSVIGMLLWSLDGEERQPERRTEGRRGASGFLWRLLGTGKRRA